MLRSKYPLDTNVNYNSPNLTCSGFLWPSRRNGKKEIAVIQRYRPFPLHSDKFNLTGYKRSLTFYIVLREIGIYNPFLCEKYNTPILQEVDI